MGGVTAGTLLLSFQENTKIGEKNNEKKVRWVLVNHGQMLKILVPKSV